MRVLLDECVPKDFKLELKKLECLTVPEAGLAGFKNGALLSAAEKQRFDVLLTVDRGIIYQQNLEHRTIAIIVLRPRSNQLVDLLPLVPDCLAALSSIKPGKFSVVG